MQIAKNPPYADAPFDPIRSTYKQVIDFPNGKQLTGYSKRMPYEEVKNKTVLLTNWICRNYVLGYLDEHNNDRDTAESIDYYWRNQEGKFIIAFTLFQTYAIWHHNDKKGYLEQFINKFYDLKSKGKNPYESLYVHAKSKPTDPLCLKKHRFKTIHFLQQHCLSLISRKVREIGNVKCFYIKYVEKYFSGFNLSDEDFFSEIENNGF